MARRSKGPAGSAPSSPQVASRQQRQVPLASASLLLESTGAPPVSSMSVLLENTPASPVVPPRPTAPVPPARQSGLGNSASRIDSMRLRDSGKAPPSPSLSRSSSAAAATAPAASEFPQFPGLRIDKQLNVSSGSASVFVGEYLPKRWKVAIKVLNVTGSEAAAFRAELDSLIQLQHECVLKVVTVYETPHHCIVTKWMDKGSLDGWLKTYKQTTGEALPWARGRVMVTDVAAGLEVAFVSLRAIFEPRSLFFGELVLARQQRDPPRLEKPQHLRGRARSLRRGRLWHYQSKRGSS